MMVDLPAPEAPVRSRISPLPTRKDRFSSTGPRAAIPGEGDVLEGQRERHGRRRCGFPRGHRRRAGAARRKNPRPRHRHSCGPHRRRRKPRRGAKNSGDQQQDEQGGGGEGEVPVQQGGEADDDDDQGGGGGEVERGGGEERDAQHAHGAACAARAPPRPEPAASSAPARQHDGGDAADTVEKAHLQPCHREELPLGRARRRRCPRPPWRTAPAGRR